MLDSEICDLKLYNLYRRNRHLAVSKHINSVNHPSWCSLLEDIWVTVYDKRKKVHLGYVFVPPSSPQDMYDLHTEKSKSYH